MLLKKQSCSVFCQRANRHEIKLKRSSNIAGGGLQIPLKLNCSTRHILYYSLLKTRAELKLSLITAQSTGRILNGSVDERHQPQVESGFLTIAGTTLHAAASTSWEEN